MSVVEQNGAKTDEGVVFRWTIDGKEYVIETGDLNGLEWRDMKHATGMTAQQLLGSVVFNIPDYEAVAAFLWVWRRRDEPRLSFDDVLKPLGMRTFAWTNREDEPDEEAEAADPPV